MARVLVVDDQSDVRAMIAIVLRVNHFEIVEAASAAEGIKAFEAAKEGTKEGTKFDLAIVDIFLQGKSGLDVISMMRDRQPDFPIVAISGMTALDFVAEAPDLSNVVCLQKPFRPNDLMRAIENARQAVAPVAVRVAV
ncbi:response regulator [Bradyrhizobium cenepequi]